MAAEIHEKIRDALFLAASRTYAEQYIEPLLRARFRLKRPEGDDHDAIDDDGRKYEIKASKVMRRRANKTGDRSLIGRILFEVDDSPLDRYFDSALAHTEDYDANIQNVKRDHFDILLYALLFRDCIKVFSAKSQDISRTSFPNWSDKHGRYDQEGKSGQFPISNRNYKWHEANNLIDTLPYAVVAEIFQSLEA